MVKAVRVLMVICLMSLFFIHPAIAESETETVKGWYVGGSLGMTMQRDSDAKFPAAVNYSADLEFDLGLSLARAVGYDSVLPGNRIPATSSCHGVAMG